MARSEFKRMIQERRNFPAGSPDHEYRTRAACTLLRLIRGVPMGGIV
jgi:hypothetical protein